MNHSYGYQQRNMLKSAEHEAASAYEKEDLMTSNGTHYTYDEIPYADLSYMQTHPNRMSMLGRLLGMTPAPVENCRVLEIGCASGGNLLPMAMVLPNSTFVGFDLSAVQIKSAVEAAAAVGLTNITFKQMDIMDVQPDFGQFDYIIAHGIFSWVPPAVREKVLDICKHNLAPQGIAYISYNTYPGWHRLEVIRNMMLYRSRDAKTPQEKAELAREWITFMAKTLANRPNSAYAAMFNDYLEFRKTTWDEMDASTFLHDELEANNQPFYFHQFMEMAEQRGLQYLAETDFPTVMPNGFSTEVVEYLGKTARTAVEREQYLDYLNDRTFRSTLLCHAEVDGDRRLTIAPLKHFFVNSAASAIEVTPEKAHRGIETFVTGDANQFSTDHPLTKAAFNYLIDTTPVRIAFPDLIREAGLHLNTHPVQEEDAVILASNLLRAFTYDTGLIDFHTFVPPMTSHVSSRPLTTPLIRFQARWRSNITNLFHERVELDNFNRLILVNLDGETDRTALLDFIVELAKDGKLDLQSTDGKPPSPDELRHRLSIELEKTLRQFALLGLLVA